MIFLTGTSGTRPPASLCPNGCFGSTLGYMWCPYCKFLLLETRKSCIALITHILQVGSLGCSHGSGLHVRTASKTHVFAFFHDNAGEPTKCLLQCRLHILLKSLIPGRLRKPLYQPPTQHSHRCPGEVHQHRQCRPQIHVLKPMQWILMLRHQSRLFLANKSNSIIITPPRSFLWQSWDQKGFLRSPERAPFQRTRHGSGKTNATE